MKKSRSEQIILTITFIIFAMYAITLVFPILWMLLNSFKTNREFFSDIWGVPSKFLYSNFIDAFNLTTSNGYNLLDMFINSIFITVLGTIISISVSSMSSYIISKYKFPLNKYIYMIAIVIMLVPSVGSLSATFNLLKNLQLYNTFLGIFLMYSGGFGFSFILLYGFFKSISWSYAEAGFMDGGSDFKIFYKIMLPQAMPAIIALAIIQGIGFWNDYFTPYMFLPSKPTLAVGLEQFVAQMKYSANWPVLFAIMLISITPVLVVFCLFQKKIMDNMVAGGLKG